MPPGDDILTGQKKDKSPHIESGQGNLIERRVLRPGKRVRAVHLSEDFFPGMTQYKGYFPESWNSEDLC